MTYAIAEFRLVSYDGFSQYISRKDVVPYVEDKIMKVGDRFKVIGDAAGFDVGTIVTFTRYEEDDHTMAWFTGTTKFNDVDEWPVVLTKVVPHVEEKELNGDGLYVVIEKESDWSHHFEIGTLVILVGKRGDTYAMYREVEGTMEQILSDCEIAPYVKEEPKPTSKALYGEEEEEVDKYATCEERGWKEGDLFTYISDDGYFPEGDIIELVEDDGDNCPLFRSVESGDAYFVYTFEVKPYMAPVEDKDMVNSPSHYNSGDIECIDAIEAALTPEEFVGYLKGNQLKYIWRMGKKGDAAQDLDKSMWYGRKLMETINEV